MNHRQRTLAALRYQPYDRLPILHFGFLAETLANWHAQGHLRSPDSVGDNTLAEDAIAGALGFDFNYRSVFSPAWSIQPVFETKVVASFPDGTQHVQTGIGSVIVQKPGARSIPGEVDHLLKDRKSWEELFKPRLQWRPERVTEAAVRVGDSFVPWSKGGLDYLRRDDRDRLYGLEAGSLYGTVRDMIGMESLCYMLADDEALVDEIIATQSDLCYQNVKYALESGAKFDFLHFWEDICFKNGPLVNPEFFAAHVGPHYQRLTTLAKRYGLDIVSLDCDGCIDALVPTWINNGVNTMFPIEVGTWDADVRPWRQAHGRNLRGVGGTNKKVFAYDRKAVDAEVERLRRLVDLGGYIPCPDHRIADDAKWELVCYYTDRLRKAYN